jgi:hypothetical protein
MSRERRRIPADYVCLSICPPRSAAIPTWRKAESKQTAKDLVGRKGKRTSQGERLFSLSHICPDTQAQKTKTNPTHPRPPTNYLDPRERGKEATEKRWTKGRNANKPKSKTPK